MQYVFLGNYYSRYVFLTGGKFAYLLSLSTFRVPLEHNLIALSYTFMYINPMFTAHIFFKNEPSSTCINFTLLSTCLKRFQKQTDLYILPVVWLDGLSQRCRSEQHSDEAKQESTSLSVIG